MAEYLILSGTSGAGRSTAAATFEDRGWFVIDNLPPALIGKVAELTSQAGAEYERVCLVADGGGYEGSGPARPEIRKGRVYGVCAGGVSRRPGRRPDRRYEGTRRGTRSRLTTSCRPSSRSAPCSRCCANRGRRRGGHR